RRNRSETGRSSGAPRYSCALARALGFPIREASSISDSSQHMIEVTGLTKRFGPITAVSALNLCVSKGEILGFLGPNGAGKSTTMKIVAGYLLPTSGSVRVLGHDVE